jgi:hypothetical protein
VNLEVLAAFFAARREEDMSALVKSTPTGRYVRVAWFLFEWLLDRRLDVPDLDQGNYIAVLDPEAWYALPEGKGARRVRRQRLIDNLPGTRDWCPMVRRTEKLKTFEAARLDRRMAEQISKYPEGVLARAARYLYARETKSSWAIESLSADARRTARFIELLRRAGSGDIRSEAELVRLQNSIAEERYAVRSYRTNQNYVGQTLGPGRELIHYIPPKPEDLRPLMDGWMKSWESMERAGIHPVVTASVAGFGFVFLHPFEDGNGRIHRFLIHHALTLGGFTPAGLIFPVSATMLTKIKDYEAVLEAYSREIGLHVDYTLDDEGLMRVTNETASLYRYPDLTVQTEALFGFIQDTLDTELAIELDYLAAFDAARTRVRDVVDMPDRKLDLFIRLCMQGKGKLSDAERRLFPELTDDELRNIETAWH